MFNSRKYVSDVFWWRVNSLIRWVHYLFDYLLAWLNDKQALEPQTGPQLKVDMLKRYLLPCFLHCLNSFKISLVKFPNQC